MPTAPTVFISYSHQDEVWKDRLLDHLGGLEEEGLLKVWSDRNLGAGDEWFEEIRNAMDAAKVAVFLVSAHSLKSKFIRHTEIPHLLERRASQGMTFFPVIVRSCAWEEFSWLSRFQARPLDGRALAGFQGNRRDAELAKLAQEILGIVRNGEPYTSSPPNLPESTSNLLQNSKEPILIVSPGFHSHSLTERQIQIAEQYNQILEAQMQPLFRFVSATRSIGLESFDALELWNEGAPIESYRIFQYSHIAVHRTELQSEGIPSSSTRLIPFYYFARRDYEGDARTGLLCTFYAWRDPVGGSPGVNITKEYKRLEAEIFEIHKFSVSIAKRVFLKIYYIDRIGTSKNIGYEVYPNDTGYGPQVPIRSTFSPNGLPAPFDLKNLTANNLFDQWDRLEEPTDLSLV